MHKLVALSLLIAAAHAVPTFKFGPLTFSSEADALFARFKSEHGKVYLDQQDEAYRKQVFTRNLQMIRTHNAEAEQGTHTFTMAMNEFGDLPFEEFHAKMTGFQGPRNAYLRSKNTANLPTLGLPASVDWTTQGAVTAVKNQGQCGSCWAFSATGSIEGAWFIANGQLIPLSEQEIMDCSGPQGNESCEGGLMDQAFEFVIANHGVCSEADYPYKAADGTCHSSSCTNAATITGFTDVQQNEDALAAAVAQQPVSVAIEADQSAFQFYSSGVMTGKCGTQLDHGVLAVGYGTLSGTDYWKVKNSWGASWGMNGYILIEKGKKQTGGQCGILLDASYPIV